MRNLALIVSVTCLTILATVNACTTRRSLPSAEPIAFDAQQEEGEKLFMQNCDRCHPGGEAGLGPAINSVPGFVKRFQVRHGLGAMPAFQEDRISDKELNNLLKYLKAMKKHS